VSATWRIEHGGYDVTIKDLKTGVEISDSCDILINAGGILNNWRWPAIPGLEKYKGKLLHTANWDDNVQLEGKHVGLIGNGLAYHHSLGELKLTVIVHPEFKSCPLSNPRSRNAQLSSGSLPGFLRFRVLRDTSTLRRRRMTLPSRLAIFSSTERILSVD
jgi:hypothetical protein